MGWYIMLDPKDLTENFFIDLMNKKFDCKLLTLRIDFSS